MTKKVFQGYRKKLNLPYTNFASIEMKQTNIDIQMKLLEDNHNTIERLSQKLGSDLNIQIRENNVFYALFMLWGNKREMEWCAEIWDLDISFDEAYQDLKKFDFEVFQIEILTDSYLIEDIALYEKKALIKSSGIVWKIHLYDSDPFPSKPHAHQLDENIKLDLSNGNCYRVRKFLKTIPKRIAKN